MRGGHRGGQAWSSCHPAAHSSCSHGKQLNGQHSRGHLALSLRGTQPLPARLLLMLPSCSKWKRCTEPAQVPRAAGSFCSPCHKRCPILLPAETGLAHAWGHDGESHKLSASAFGAQNPNVSSPLNTWSSTSAH